MIWPGGKPLPHLLRLELELPGPLAWARWLALYLYIHCICSQAYHESPINAMGMHGEQEHEHIPCNAVAKWTSHASPLQGKRITYCEFNYTSYCIGTWDVKCFPTATYFIQRTTMVLTPQMFVWEMQSLLLVGKTQKQLLEINAWSRSHSVK